MRIMSKMYKKKKTIKSSIINTLSFGSIILTKQDSIAADPVPETGTQKSFLVVF